MFRFTRNIHKTATLLSKSHFNIDELLGSESVKHNRFATRFDKKQPPSKKPVKHAVKTNFSPRKPTFEFQSGSVQAQAALKDLIMQIKDVSPQYKVRYVNPNTGKIDRTHLVNVANELDLTKFGLIIVGASDEVPMVKQVKVADMISKYTDRLALQKEKELLEMGSRTAQKVVNQRLRVEKKKSALKVLEIKWKISIADLKNQKTNEIARRIDKGEKFTIYIKSKNQRDDLADQEEDEESTGSSNNILYGKMDEEELSIELKRREMVYTTVLEILDELPCSYKVEGKLETRLSIHVQPEKKEVQPERKDTKAEEKDAKKEKKTKKEKKKKEKLEDQDLDAMYLMKIED